MQKKNSLDKETFIHIVKGGLIAGGGVALTYILQAISMMEFGEWTAIVVGICSILINAIREFIKGE